MKKILILILFPLLYTASFAQYKFLAPNASNQYDAKVFVNDYNKNICSGKGTVIIYDKATNREVQSFHSENLIFTLNEKQKGELGWLELGKYQSPMIFGDFNFDGNEDIAIRNGTNPKNNSAAYDIYLFNSANNFVLDPQLTKLASTNMGMFLTDKVNKQVSIEEETGCCIHKTIHFQKNDKEQWAEVSSVIEDLSVTDYVTVITQTLIDGKIKRTVEKFKTKDYYKQ